MRFGKLFVCLLLVEEELVDREVKEKLNSAAKSVGDEGRKALGNILGNEPALEGGSEPSGEADKSDGENYVDGKSDRHICVGVEGLVSVDEERDDLSDYVAGSGGDEEAEAVALAACGSKYKELILLIDEFIGHKELNNNGKHRLNNESTETDNDELDKLPKSDYTLTLAVGGLINLIKFTHVESLLTVFFLKNYTTSIYRLASQKYGYEIVQYYSIVSKTTAF